MQRSARHYLILFLATDANQRLRPALEFGVVAAVVLIVITLAVRTYETFVVRSQVTEAFFLASTVRSEIAVHRAEHGRWTVPATDLNDPALTQGRKLGKFVDHIELDEDGAISAVFSADTSTSALSGRRLTFRPMIALSEPSAPAFWACGAHGAPKGFTAAGQDKTDIDESYLPSTCREF